MHTREADKTFKTSDFYLVFISLDEVVCGDEALAPP